MLLKYQVRHGAKLVSQHRHLDTAERALRRLLRGVAQKGDDVLVFTVWARRVVKQGDTWAVPILVGVVEDADGNERAAAKYFASVVRLHDKPPPKRRSSRRRLRKRTSVQYGVGGRRSR